MRAVVLRQASCTSTSMAEDKESLGALRDVPFMGVIYVVHEASKLGFKNGDPDWCNLGQGQPEVSVPALCKSAVCLRLCIFIFYFGLCIWRGVMALHGNI